MNITLILSILKHEYYEEITYLNDIAVLILEEDVVLSRTVQLACLPKYSETYPTPDTIGYLTGWGQTHFEKFPNLLENVKLTVQANAKCLELDSYFEEKIQFCAGLAQKRLIFYFGSF